MKYGLNRNQYLQIPNDAESAKRARMPNAPAEQIQPFGTDLGTGSVSI
jgi:hypothetical protein